MTLADKTVLVTGAARGIGRACAEAFGHAGASVALADVLEDDCQKAADDIARETGAKTLPVVANIARDDDCEALVASALDRFGTIDVLINNAGIIAPGDILEVSRDDFDQVLRVNLRAAFVLSQLVAKHMVERGISGSIINMSSVNAVMTIPNQLPYAVAKGGLAQLTRTMAVGLAKHGIRVNAIGPGSIETDILKAVMKDEAARRNILSRTPMGRVGRVEEVASIAVFLAGEGASYVTGQTIYADGGRLPLNYTVPVSE